MNQPILRIVASVLAVGLLAAGCGGKQPSHPDSATSGSNGASCEASASRITISTGPAGAVFYALGSGLAQLINGNTKLKATAAETAGSTQNIQQLARGDYDMAFSAGEPVDDAVNGKGLFDGEPQKIQALTRLHSNYIYVIVRADSGITSVANLRGKRVSTGPPSSIAEVTANRVLRAAGLDPEKDIQAQRLDLTKATDSFRSGTVDAFLWLGGVSIAQITELTTSLKDEVRFLDVTSLLDEMKKASPVYDQGVIPAGNYRQLADIPTIVVPSVLLVREDFPVGDACAITKLIFEKKVELERVHPAGKDILLNRARQTDPVKLHPGARQALDALGG